MRMNIIRRLLARHRFPQILLLGLMAVGILIKPILFTMGEMHELQDNPKAVISHVYISTSHEGDPQESGQDGRTNASALHALTNFAHNCDQPTCTEIGCFASLSAVLSRLSIPTLSDSWRESVRPSSLLRPPIL